ncbi:16254_t:CDS:10 [Funneliformis caledonium]|uniref:16254_t:CDS:1 n=1 Tax=Funneliformis caledonium TaxID=1117310 RepID=A0A9N9GVT1_9GLOM|nr:16254_t:CDS:10 [Funneliformis caledonium]
MSTGKETTNIDPGQENDKNASLSSDFHLDANMHYIEAIGKWTYTSEDGETLQFDEDQQQWIKIEEDLLLKLQQSAYSVPGVNESEPAVPLKRGKRKNVYTSDNVNIFNTNIFTPFIIQFYVTGLPPDVTVNELAEVFSKYGVLMEDLIAGGPKIKLYKDDKDRLKGDALVTYLKEESVALACQLLDETQLRPDEVSIMRVQKAQFKEKEPKSDVNQIDNANTKIDKKKVHKKLQQLEKKLDWYESEPGKKVERYSKIVILKNMFTLDELENDISLILDLKEDIRNECEKLGEVTNVILYDKEPDGVVSVKFKDQLSADACVVKMNGRFFAGRRIEAEIFDGKQKFQKTGAKSGETEEEESARLEKYSKWLEQEGTMKIKENQSD